MFITINHLYYFREKNFIINIFFYLLIHITYIYLCNKINFSLYSIPNDAFTYSASLNNKCFEHVIQSIDNDRQFFYATSSVGSSSNLLGTSNYYNYYNPSISGSNYNSNNSNNNNSNNSNNNNNPTILNATTSNNYDNNNDHNSNDDINNINENKNDSNNNSNLSPLLSFKNASSANTGITLTGVSLYSQSSIPSNSIYSNSLQSQHTLSEINVPSTIISRSNINKKK